MLNIFRVRKLGAFKAHGWQSTLRRHFSVSFARETSITERWESAKSIHFFHLLTHRGRWSLKKSVLCKAMPSWVTFVDASKNNIRIRHFVKKRKLSLCANEKKGWRYKVNKSHSPALSSMGQNKRPTCLLWKVQHLNFTRFLCTKFTKFKMPTRFPRIKNRRLHIMFMAVYLRRMGGQSSFEKFLF